MSPSLRDFVFRAVEHKRIRFGDLRRLKRDILPARITTREQAEVLIALDSSLDKADREWRRYLIGTIRDYVIWGSPATLRGDHLKIAAREQQSERHQRRWHTPANAYSRKTPSRASTWDV